MLKRKVRDTDGDCFAKCEKREQPNECVALQERLVTECGTYGCPFYKPLGCEDWIRLEEDGEIHLYAPEEVRTR